MTTLFPKSDSHTYKVVATRRSGKQMTYNYVQSIDVVDDIYLLIGRPQNDRMGTMENRSFTLTKHDHPELDVRQISTTRSMPQTQQTAPVGAMEGDEIPF